MKNYIFVLENITLEDFYSAWDDMDMNSTVNELLEILCDEVDTDTDNFTQIRCMEFSNENYPRLLIRYNCDINDTLKQFNFIKKIILKLLNNMFKEHNTINKNVYENIKIDLARCKKVV